jgi:hypothetical protein
MPGRRCRRRGLAREMGWEKEKLTVFTLASTALVVV